MKKQSSAAVIRDVSVHLFFLLTLMASTLIANAQQKDSPSHIQYLGKVKGQSMVEVNFINTDNKPFRVILTNDEGTRIYSEKIETGNFSKRFIIVKDENDDAGLDLTLHIRSDNKSLLQVLKVSTTSVTKEEVYIAGIKQ